ncbi:PD-(D/E)XK motif protein [Streptosporangium sp. NPDC000563]|uniref:PD-(D/E)XK motif protein n=1 Tax=Streptosporangium sp. NPDC000563 TaxID=3154366 RepID=UPI0033245B35
MTTNDRVWQAQLRARWAVLSTRRNPAGVVTSGMGITVSDGTEVLAGIDARGDHHLLVPTGVDASITEDSQAAYVRIQRCTLVVDGYVRTYADIVCHRTDLSELFDDILAAMLAQLAAGPAERPDAVCKRVLDEWRELLRHRGGLLGDDALRGLFGELIILEQILMTGDAHNLSVWRGPDREPHDFHLPGGDLEVKTLGAAGSAVRIHGIEQLEPPENSNLHLIMVRLATDRDGLALPDLVERIQQKASDRRAFAIALARAGYGATDAEHYRDRRFIVTQIAALPVDDGFPRIVPSSLADSLPDEVSALSYTLDLSLLLPNALTGASIAPLFAKGALS